MSAGPDVGAQVAALLGHFKLTTAAAELGPALVRAGFDEALGVVHAALEREADSRRARRVERLLRAAHLPPGKTMETLETARLPRPLAAQLRALATGAFVDDAINVLCFGLPGVGKTHAACALGHALVRKGRSVFFAPAFELVQELLAAKRDLRLPRALRKYDAFDVLVIDDLGYVQQSPAEAEVLFTLLAERYERRSLVLTSNLVFSQWDRIFTSPLTTAAAIDRLVHHAVVLEFDVASFRTERARTRAEKAREARASSDDADEPSSPREATSGPTT
jgi:DNA replication protein DnaC